jgi:hypothetical protein
MEVKVAEAVEIVPLRSRGHRIRASDRARRMRSLLEKKAKND